jgi:hypothetical protein
VIRLARMALPAALASVATDLTEVRMTMQPAVEPEGEAGNPGLPACSRRN